MTKNRSQTQRILLVGCWRYDIYEDALASGLRTCGCEVVPFKTDQQLSGGRLRWVQAKLKLGPAVNRLNSALVDLCANRSFDGVFLHSADLILPRTLERIHTVSPYTTILVYHNDNPFIGTRNRLKWRHYLASIPRSDATLVYRPSNVADARRHGARRVFLFLPYFMTYRHRPMLQKNGLRELDVLFVGHYEPDGRAEALDHLVRNGVSLRVYGGRWHEVAQRYTWLSSESIRAVLGDEYPRLLSSAKIALVFLSHLQRDVWTRRCFEIPACGTLMLAPRTPELEQLFADGREAVYYDSKDDLLDKIRYYVTHDAEREQIAHAGWRRCTESGHNEIGRARQLVEIINQVRREK